MTVRLIRRGINPLVRWILRSPFHGLLSGSLLLLTYAGRKSGRRYTIPVMYARDGDGIVVFVGRPERKRWWRNLRGGAPVTLRIAGALRDGWADVVTEDPDAMPAAVRSYLAKFRRAAGSMGAADRAVMVRISFVAASAQTPALRSEDEAPLRRGAVLALRTADDQDRVGCRMPATRSRR